MPGVKEISGKRTILNEHLGYEVWFVIKVIFEEKLNNKNNLFLLISNDPTHPYPSALATEVRPR